MSFSCDRAARSRPAGALDPIYTPAILAEGRALLAGLLATGRANSGWPELKAFLVKATLGWMQRLDVDTVGTHYFNRGGAGVSGGQAQKHGCELDTVGFTWLRWEGVVVQKHPRNDYDVEWNNTQIAKSDALIPKFKGLMQGSTIGGSHTTVWCRQVKNGVKALHAHLGNEAGILDRAKLCLNRPDFAEALDLGLPYFMLHYQVDEAWPGIIDYIQKALNVVASTSRNEVEVLTDMWSHAQAMGEALDWSKVEEECKKTLAPCTKYLPACTAYLKAHSGTLLPQAPAFVKAFDTGRDSPALGGEYIYEVANLRGTKTDKIPFIAHAFIEAGLASPKVQDGFAKTIAPSKVKQANSKGNKDKLMEGNVIRFSDIAATAGPRRPKDAPRRPRKSRRRPETSRRPPNGSIDVPRRPKKSQRRPRKSQRRPETSP